jgi:hypothetical protein
MDGQASLDRTSLGEKQFEQFHPIAQINGFSSPKRLAPSPKAPGLSSLELAFPPPGYAQHERVLSQNLA